MNFGLFMMPLHPPRRSVADSYDRDMELLVQADRLGYHEAWIGDEDWHRIEVPAERCPRITPEFLARERLALGETWFEQEYGCAFSETADQVFSAEDVARAFSDDVEPLFA